MSDPRRVRLGARWDEPVQDDRLRRAFDAGLIDYVEANYPITPGHPPRVGPDVPVFVHCPINAVASPQGVNLRLADQVREAAFAFDSPWVGEHLCWAGPGDEGRLGYIVTPSLADEFVEVAVENTKQLAELYGRPVALELAPVYQKAGEIESEVHFLDRVAAGADARIIFDVAHWTASNRNLQRPPEYGLDAVDRERIIELHIAGIRPSNSGRWWHDSHDRVPEDAVVAFTKTLVDELPALEAVTFEHDPTAPEEDFVATLRMLREVVPS